MSRLDRPLELDRRFRARAGAFPPDPIGEPPFTLDELPATAWEAAPASVADRSSQLSEDAACRGPETVPAPGLGAPGPLVVRALAAALDLAVSLAVAAPPLAVAAWMLPAGADRLGSLAWPGAGLFALLCFAHATLGHALMGATVGQRLLGLRIAAADGFPPRLGRAALRAALTLLGLGLLPPLFTAGRRTLHDRIAGTWTVRAP
jgi:uncharacterized RDD family membrane protein YckC